MIKKLSLNLALAYALIFIVAVSSIDILLILAYRKNQLNKTEYVYTEVAKFLSSMAEKNLKISNLINTDNSLYSGSLNGRILYLDNEGRVLSDSLSEFEGRKITNREIRSVLSGKKSSSGYYSLNGRNIIMFAYPVLTGSDISGIIIISSYIDEVYNEINTFIKQVVLISTVIFAFVIALSIFMGEQITKPVKKLTSASEEILKGNIGTTVAINRKDEIGVLVKTFNLMSEELYKIDTGRKRFVSDISHELKTPLASIKVLVESLLEGEPDIETCKEYLSDINTEIDRLTSLVKSLLTSARLEEIQLKIKSVNIYDEVQNVLKIFEPMAQKNNIELKNNCTKEIFINVDREMFREVMINLFDNGIKYGSEQGVLSIATQISDKNTELVVKDNGIGISEKDLPFIFDNFYRVDEARSTEKSGSGIGLFIVKRISELHGWNIEVKSVPGNGTEFRISF